VTAEYLALLLPLLQVPTSQLRLLLLLLLSAVPTEQATT
jgi:hypothetical protein